MTRSRFRRVLMLGATAVLFCIPVTLSGHAYLVGSDPRADTTLESAPARVTVVFAQDIEPAGSRIRILDSQGNPIEIGESMVDPASPRRISVTINQELDNGTYTVLWRNVSARDGHPLQDYFLFSVGEPLDTAAIAPGAGGSTVAQPVSAAGRWLTLLGIAVIVGGGFFHLVAVSPQLRSGGLLSSVATELDRRRWIVTWGGTLLFLIGSLGELIGQGRIMEASPGVVIADTTWGINWLIRIGIWVVLVVVLTMGYRSSRSSRDSSSAEPIALLVGAGALFALALTSHVGVGTGVRAPAVLNHYIHQVAAGAWVGSLIYLAAAGPVLITSLPADRLLVLLPPILRKFRALVIACVIVLVTTGFYNTWIQVTVPAAVGTAYGETLITKILLVVVLFLTAGLNLLYVRPKIGAGTDGVPRLFGRIVKGEVLIAALILLTVGFLAGTEPARLAADRLGLLASDRDTVFTAEDEGTSVTLSVEPAVVGRNRLIIDLEDSVGNPVTAENVLLQVSNLPDQSMEFDRNPSRVEDGRYVAERVAMTTVGSWRAVVTVIRPDAFDARVSFEFRVAEPPIETADLLTTGIAWSLFAIQAVFLVLIVWAARSLGSRERNA